MDEGKCFLKIKETTTRSYFSDRLRDFSIGSRTKIYIPWIKRNYDIAIPVVAQFDQKQVPHPQVFARDEAHPW